MSGKYIVSESSSVIRAMETNLQQSQRIADTLKRATSQLTSALQSGDLKGKTYGSAKNYVLNVLNPLMNKASEGISDGLSDLATYKYEDGQIAHYGNIDVDQLKEEKQIKEEARRKVESQRDRLQNLPLSALAVASPVAYAGALGAMASFEQNMNDSIKKIDEKLLAYETFNSNTNGLFGDADALFENLENALNALSGIKISGSGSNLSLSIPSNVGGLVNKTTSSKLVAGDSDSGYSSLQAMANEMGVSVEEAQKLCKKYNVSPNDDIYKEIISYTADGQYHVYTITANKTTGEILSVKGGGSDVQNNFLQYINGQIDNEFNRKSDKVIGATRDDVLKAQLGKQGMKQFSNTQRTMAGLGAIGSAIVAETETEKTLNTEHFSEKGFEYVISEEKQKELDEQERKKQSELESQKYNSYYQQNHAPGSKGGAAPN